MLLLSIVAIITSHRTFNLPVGEFHYGHPA